MEALKWIMSHFEAKYLLAALLATTISIGSLIVGYRKDEIRNDPSSSLGWWKDRKGRILTFDEFTKAFNSVISTAEKEKVRLQVKKKDGQIIVGTLSAQSSGPSGYMYTFQTADGKLIGIHISELDQVAVLSIDE